MKFSEAVERWEMFAVNRLSFRSFTIYKKRLLYLLNVIGNSDLPLAKTEIAHAIGQIKSPSVKEQTIASYQNLRKFLLDFHDVEMPEIPDFIRPKKKKNLPKPVSEEVFRKMLEIARERAKNGLEWNLAAIILLGYAGLRASEVLSITPHALEKRENTIWIRVVGKGNKERRVPLPDNEHTQWLCELLRPYGRSFW